MLISDTRPESWQAGNFLSNWGPMFIFSRIIEFTNEIYFLKSIVGQTLNPGPWQAGNFLSNWGAMFIFSQIIEFTNEIFFFNQ